METPEDLVIFGIGDYGRVASALLAQDSPYRVKAFTVHGQYLDRKELLGHPVVPFEDLIETHPPDSYSMLVAVGYSKMNSRRTEVYNRSKELGYRFIRYVSSR